MSQDLSSFKSLFDKSSKNYLDVMVRGLKELKQNPQDIKTIEEIYRSSHSLKGENAIMKHLETASLANVIENIFYNVREKKITINDSLLTLLLESVSHLHESLKMIHDNNQEIHLDEDILKLEAATGVKREI
jgi:two-component system chemotaxis sensor kinase CheA